MRQDICQEMCQIAIVESENTNSMETLCPPCGLPTVLNIEPTEPLKISINNPCLNTLLQNMSSKKFCEFTPGGC